MNHLNVDRVTVAFDDVTVLADASLSLERGEVVALLGASGSGKSTLLRVVAGVIAPDAGSVELAGSDITTLPTHQRGVGMVFQDNQLFPHLSVGDNVAFGLKMAGVNRAGRRKQAATWLQRVGLEALADRSVSDLSGGEAKRVAVARTLATGPDVVLLDEPLTGLDRELHDQLVSELAALLSDLSVTAILVTHDHEEAETIATRVVQMTDING